MRIFRLIATPVILLGLLGVLLWSASWGWRALTAPLPSASPTPCITQEAAVLSPAQVSINVYNGGTTSGLAGRVGNYFEKAGFNLGRIANTEQKITTTVVRGNPDQQAHLDLVVSHFKSAAVEYDERIDGSVDVLVGTEFDDFADKPLAEVQLSTGSTCVVAPSASPSA